MTRNTIRYTFAAGCCVILFHATVPYLTGFGSVQEFWGW